MKTTFEKIEYTEQFAQDELNNLVAKFESNLKVGYTIVSSTYCISNGLSMYVKIQKENELPFEFRISDHENSVGNEIVNTGYSYKINSSNIFTMYRFFGDISPKEARIAVLIDGIEKCQSKETSAYKMLTSELKRLQASN